ncbi:MAG: pyruvate, phosphate dikinase [Candidatus Woesearchaeota archaeon]|jgi:pyruvate,orthophosphate dikinase
MATKATKTEVKTTSNVKRVYYFGDGSAEGNKSMKELLGGKGANLAEMSTIGVPVPSGFTITTNVCDEYYKVGKKLPAELMAEVKLNLAKVEKSTGMKLGDATNPLLVSVRSGAASSMPGMMDTILNLGLNDVTVQALIKKTGNERFAWDAYRRFLQMFGDVVLEVPHHDFEEVLDEQKKKKGVKLDTDLDAKDLKEVVAKYKAAIKKATGKDFPQDSMQQLILSVEAVFGSWNNDRAILYRKLNDIKGLLGTAVNIQAMVFGNMGNTSGTGVCFTRNPSTGENKFYGEYLMNAQGEDVVAGIRTPLSIDQLEKSDAKSYKQLCDIRLKLEKHYKDMQDMEFTIQEGKLYMLQTRNGKRTAQAAVKCAVDMVAEKLITKEEAVLRVDPNSLDQLLHKTVDPKNKEKAIAKGLPASPGAAVGKICFDAHEAAKLVEEKDEDIVLVRIETSPEDLIGMNAANGILTARGGMTSHAAVFARGMGKCCVAGCSDIKIDYKKKTMEAAGKILKDGDYITLNGSTGEVFAGKINTVDPEMKGEFAVLMSWADSFRKLKVRTNADIPRDAIVAKRFGAEGIGLCRTEHMFFEGDRIKAMREMIVAKDLEGRKKALAKLLPYQRADFKGLFEEMAGLPVTIRLLDPPLHEFLPQKEEDMKAIAKEVGVTLEELKQKIDSLHELNPMLGHRGCRLGIAFPEITEMQVRAIMEAACELKIEKKMNVVPEIMIPLVGNVKEFENQKAIALKVIEQVFVEKKVKLEYQIGTMIEVPRGALTADEIAKEAEFFSFGTNDLTQMTLGFSRDDAGKFLPQYVSLGIYDKDVFAVLDQTGVGQLMKIAIEKGKSVRPNIKLGICGEHGGEPSSVMFCHKIGLNYVSCSPFRVPIAKLAAAHAALKFK